MIMDSIKQIVKNVGTMPVQPSVAQIETLVVAALGEDAANVEVLGLTHGPVSGRRIIIFHINDSKQLLVWSTGLNAVIDLAKIIPAPVPRNLPACYKPMLEIAESMRGSNVWPATPCWISSVSKLATGNFAKFEIETFADLFSHSHTVAPDRGGLIVKDILAETMAWHHNKAIL